MDEMFTDIGNGLSAFICRHSDEDCTAADALMEEVRERLAGGSDALIPRPVTASDFLTRVVYSLWWDYRASITEIVCDQWCMVTADRFTDKFHVRVECDEVEDGIAAVWKAFADHVPPADNDGEGRA